MNNEEFKAKLTTLEEVSAAEKQEFANAFGAILTENQTLRDQIAEGFTNAELQAHADRVDAIIAGVKEIVPNLPDPVEEEE